MALQIALNKTPIGIAFPEAYARVTEGRWKLNPDGTATCHVTVSLYTSAAARQAKADPVKQMSFTTPLDLTGTNQIAQAYTFLKTRAEFAGSKDV